MKKMSRIAIVLAAMLTCSSVLSGCVVVLGLKTAEMIREKYPDIGYHRTEASDETHRAEDLPEYDPEESAFEEGMDFASFTDAVFADILDGNTLNIHFYLADPSAYGLDNTAATWGDVLYTDDASAEYEDWLYDVLTYLQGYDMEELTEEEQLVHDMLEEYCYTELDSIGLELYYEPLGPNTGFQAQLPIYFAEYAFDREQDVQNYLSLMEQLPDYFSDLVAYEGQKAEAGLFMEDALLDNVIDQCEQFLAGRENSFLYENFNEKLAALDLSEEKRTEYEDRNRELVENGVYAAYEILIDGLEAFRGSNVCKGGLCNYPSGYAYYSYLVRSGVGTSMSPEQLCERLDQEMDRGILRLQKLYQKNPDVYEEWESIVYPSTDPNLLMHMLITATEKDYPALSEVDYNIDYVDESLREYLSPACYFIPPVDTTTINNILINCDRGEEPENIFTTMAHEGYPGHLFQTNFLKEHSNLVLHQLLGTGGFAEGWAEYVELNSYYLIDGVSDDAAEFAKINDFVTLCLYARADLGVHAEGWDVEDVSEFVEEYFGEGNEDAAEWIYEYVLGDPGGYLDYVVGAIEIEDIRTQASKEADYTLKGFHEELLTLSGAPFSIIRKYMFE